MPQFSSRKRTRCYLCRQRVPTKVFTKYGYDILKCKSCQLLTLKFQQDYRSFISEYYDERFFTGSQDRIGYSNYEGDQLTEAINMKRYLTRISRFKSTGKLLDVGCATGIFLEFAQAKGFDPFGFDVSTYAVTKARHRLKHRIKQAVLSDVTYKPNSFDVITMFDVVEHLKDPRRDLKRLRTFLKDDGVLVINTGDAGSLLAKLMGKNWHFYVPPQHLFFFSQKTLTQLLHRAGYKVIKIEYKGKWLSLRYFLNLVKQIHHSKIANLLHQAVADNIIGKLPLYFNFFDNILIYAQKDPN